MNTIDLSGLSERLDTARRNGEPTQQLTIDYPDLSLEEAYAIQRKIIQRRIDRGERITGVKLGLTSKAKAEQMGVTDVIICSVTEGMEIENNGVINIINSVHSRVEPEIAFRLARDIDPTDSFGDDLLEIVDAVAPALEVIDSRYENFKFSLPDVVADITSASAYTVGAWTKLDRDLISLKDRKVQLLVDNEVVETGTTTAILEDPWEAVFSTVRMAARYGHVLLKGGVLLAGAATAAVPIAPNTRVEALVEGLGAVSLNVVTKGQA